MMYLFLFIVAFWFGRWSYSQERREILDEQTPTRKQRREKLRELWWGFLGITSLLAMPLTAISVYLAGEWMLMNTVATLSDGVLIGGLTAALKRWNLRRKRKRKLKKSQASDQKTA